MKLEKLTIKIMNEIWGYGQWDKTSPATKYWQNKVKIKQIKSLEEALREQNNPLKPSANLLIKLGSVIIHQEEMASSNGHLFDKYALDTVRNDVEVIEWLDQMTKMSLLPLKR